MCTHSDRDATITEASSACNDRACITARSRQPPPPGDAMLTCLADVNEEDELTTMFCMFTDALAGVRNSTLADLLAVRTRVAP